MNLGDPAMMLAQDCGPQTSRAVPARQISQAKTLYMCLSLRMGQANRARGISQATVLGLIPSPQKNQVARGPLSRQDLVQSLQATQAVQFPPSHRGRAPIHSLRMNWVSRTGASHLAPDRVPTRHEILAVGDATSPDQIRLPQPKPLNVIRPRDAGPLGRMV
jgi:hypothetical protein